MPLTLLSNDSLSFLSVAYGRKHCSDSVLLTPEPEPTPVSHFCPANSSRQIGVRVTLLVRRGCIYAYTRCWSVCVEQYEVNGLLIAEVRGIYVDQNL